MEKPLFIVFEGPDGVGKTTLIEEVVKRLRAKLFKSPPDPFKSMRATVDTQWEDPSARCSWYFGANIYLAYLIRLAIEAGQTVVCDRYYPSTVAFHKAQGVATDVLLGDLPKDILAPDIAFLITCDRETQVRRMTEGREGGLTPNDKRALKLGDKYVEEFRALGMVEIDNSTNDPNVAVNAMMDHINRRLQSA